MGMMPTKQPNELDTSARAVIEAARGAHEPNELSRARVQRSLDLKLAAGAALVIGPASALAGAAKVTLAVVSVSAVVGAGLYVLPRHAPAPAPHRAPVTTPAPRAAHALPPMPAAAPEEPAPAPVALAPRLHHRPASGHGVAVAHVAAPETASRLREETALLAAANAALAAHHVGQAMALLDDYDRQAGASALPGLLAEERAATGILALCADGREDAARADARRFRARWPRSPLTARIAGSCAGAGSRPAP